MIPESNNYHEESNKAYTIPYSFFMERCDNVDENSPTCQKMKCKIDDILKNHTCFDTELNKISFETFHKKWCNSINKDKQIQPISQSFQNNTNKPFYQNKQNTFRQTNKNSRQGFFYSHYPHNNHINVKSNYLQSRRDKYNQPVSFRNNDLQVRKRLGDTNELERNILSLLNKISPQNFEKVKNKILLQCSDEEITKIIVVHILKKAHKDFSFIQIYMQLLRCISKKFHDTIKEASYNLLQNFVNTLPSVLCKITLNIYGENNLSLFIKAKKDLYDINKCICTLFVYNFIDMNPIIYLENIKFIFDEILKQSDYEIYDIFIHFLFDFFTIHNSKQIKMETKPMINDLLDQKNESICSKRTDFKWQDLIQFFQF